MANFQSDDRSKIGRAYRICKIVHGSVITDGDISSQAKEVKMTVHIGFVFKYTQHLLVMATTSNQATETKINCMLLSCHVRVSE